MSKTYSMQFGVGDPRTYTGLAPTMLIFANLATGATVAAPAISEALTGSGIYKFTWGTTTPIAFLADAATTSPGSQGRYVVGQIDPADRADEYGTTLVAFGTTLFGQGSTNFALGTTSVAIGTTLLGFGSTLMGFGATSVALGTTNVALAISNYSFATMIFAGLVNQGSTIVGIGTTLLGIGSSVAVLAAGIGSTASTFGSSSADPVDLFGYMKRIQENLEGNSSFTKLSGAWSIYSRGSSQLLASKTVANNSSQVIKT
jgi:hypothetical protein